MESSARPPRLIRFGVFEVDPEAGELRKQGLKIKLQEQPFQVLALLLEQPGRARCLEGARVVELVIGGRCRKRDKHRRQTHGGEFGQ